MTFKNISVIVSLVLIMFMSAIETSIVSLALPTMRDDLNAIWPVSFVFTAYFIGIVLVIPILSELMARVRVIYITILGLILFVSGSLLSGVSTTFGMLIFARFIQGVGAGVNMSLAQIVPKLAFNIPFRYKVMGIVGSVWGISSILGPFLGGFILEVTTWHWLFFINIPIGVVAAVFVLYAYHFDNETTVKHAFDYKGMLFFYLVIIGLMLVVVGRLSILFSLLIGVLVLVCSVWLWRYSQKRHTSFIPTQSFQPIMIRVFFTDFFTAFMLIGFNVFVPTYLQDYVGLTPLQSGLIIFPLTVGWLIINFTLDKIEARLSLYRIYMLAFTLIGVGSLMVYVMPSHIYSIAIVLFCVGMSFGVVYTKDSVIVQEHSLTNQMKKMVSLFTLTRNLGNASGSAMIGVIYAWHLEFIKWPIQNVMIASMVIIMGLIFIWLRRIDVHGL
ncbi:multidrug efflux MFS transporter SdrM [Staphylococcus sp. 17KM0847]|uniref:multidrug efflux MFS transporter SdrM n=1 Tax=Staphylococcus sp. 17KM0847 TaxID=2583989 RepID=UPI0015DCE538|nr:multidrug efflux MFS transporter SdrM [Staphylococcus sp. 17KM0847]QLK86558.1 MFS transporter [Staphylococcus sp. 17KM0847]